MSVVTKTFEVLNFAANRRIACEELACIQDAVFLESRIDDHVAALVIQMRMKVMADSVENHVAERIPADWWEAVKERFAWARWISRSPVRYREVRVNVYELYPHLKVPGSHSRFIRVQMFEPE